MGASFRAGLHAVWGCQRMAVCIRVWGGEGELLKPSFLLCSDRHEEASIICWLYCVRRCVAMGTTGFC